MKPAGASPRLVFDGPGDSSALFDAYARVPNLHRALAYTPEVLAGWRGLASALREVSLPERLLLELAILRVAFICRSEYVWKNHVRSVRSLGLSSGKLKAVVSQRLDGEGLTASEFVYVRLADQIASTGGVDDKLWQEVSAVAAADQVVRAVTTVSVYVAASAIVRSLGVPLEPDTAEIEDGWHD